jgi:hypothetical protein
VVAPGESSAWQQIRFIVIRRVSRYGCARADTHEVVLLTDARF